jgi:hypothetical protein
MEREPTPPRLPSSGSPNEAAAVSSDADGDSDADYDSDAARTPTPVVNPVDDWDPFEKMAISRSLLTGTNSRAQSLFRQITARCLRLVPESYAAICAEETRTSFPQEILERDERVALLRHRLQGERAHGCRLLARLTPVIKV